MKPIYLIPIFLLLTACAQTQVQSIPNFTTPSEKECARQCMSIYAQCNTACSNMRGGIRTANQRQTCLENCNTTLNNCYLTCKE